MKLVNVFKEIFILSGVKFFCIIIIIRIILNFCKYVDFLFYLGFFQVILRYLNFENYCFKVVFFKFAKVEEFWDIYYQVKEILFKVNNSLYLLNIFCVQGIILIVFMNLFIYF